MKFFKANEIFAINEFDVNKVIKHNIYGETLITYDNVFKNPHKVKDYFLESPAPRFMAFPAGYIGSDAKNFVEYWDCRHGHMMDRILELYKIIDKITSSSYDYSFMKKNDPYTQTQIRTVITNLFQWKDRPPLENIPDCFGGQPHPDGDRNWGPKYALTLSLNDEKDIRKNGIAFWESLQGKHTTDAETKEFNKKLTATASGRSYYHECPEKDWKMPPKFLKHDFNKAFLYPVNIFHCAHHDKLDFMDYPRITMVQFL